MPSSNERAEGPDACPFIVICYMNDLKATCQRERLARNVYQRPQIGEIEHLMRPLERNSLTNQIIEKVRMEIMLGDLEPGARLTFREIAERLSASVTPVREALLQLVASRVLMIGSDRTITVPILTCSQYLELRRIRVLLEGELAESAATHAQGDLVERLQEIQSALTYAQKNGDARASTIHNRDFHFTLYGQARMPEFFATAQMIWLRTGPCNRYIYADPESHVYGRSVNGKPPRLHEHLAVIEGLRAGRPELVRSALVRDLIAGDEVILRRLASVGPAIA